MNYLEIAGSKYSGVELADITADRLYEIGVKSFQSIEVSVRKNHLSIAFDNEQDVEIVKAISGSESQSLNNIFETRNADLFLLSLVNTSHQPGFC